MQKFTCGHCGGRIAVTRRNMGKLVVCPECGKSTHPLAVEILAAAKDGPAVRAGSAEPIERKCENCGRVIGRLEQPKLWKTHVVCITCHPILAQASGDDGGAATESVTPVKAKRQPAAKRGTKAVPLLEAVPAEKGVVALPDELPKDGSNLPTIVAERMGKAIVTAAVKPIQVQVNRAAGKWIPAPSQHRTLVLVIALFIGGCALYGLLALLQNLMGILITIAVILVSAAVGLVLARLLVQYLGQWIPPRWIPKRWRRGGSNDKNAIVMSEKDNGRNA